MSFAQNGAERAFSPSAPFSSARFGARSTTIWGFDNGGKVAIIEIALGLPEQGGVTLKLELTKKEFRRLLDMVYIGNWILNSTRGEDRIKDYDRVESLLFLRAAQEGMPSLAEIYEGEIVPSRAFSEGGIHEAIMQYENDVFFDILAEDLARRDMDDPPIDESNYPELASRIDAYISEFEEHGTDNILVDSDNL